MQDEVAGTGDRSIGVVAGLSGVTRLGPHLRAGDASAQTLTVLAVDAAKEGIAAAIGRGIHVGHVIGHVVQALGERQ
ncbi:hypothetical protein D3C76_1629640 [compost metagenome]